jgi:hypothetical protein
MASSEKLFIDKNKPNVFSNFLESFPEKVSKSSIEDEHFCHLASKR